MVFFESSGDIDISQLLRVRIGDLKWSTLHDRPPAVTSQACLSDWAL